MPNLEKKILNIVGKNPPGTVCTDIPHGFSLKSNPIPQSSTLGNLGLPHGAGDVVYLFNSVTKTFVAHPLDDLGFPSSSATVGIGESFWFYRAGSPTRWCRTFFL